MSKPVIHRINGYTILFMKSKSKILKTAKANAMNAPYLREKGIIVAKIGSTFGTRNGISRMKRHKMSPIEILK